MNQTVQLKALIAFAEAEAYCPCCQEVRDCLPGCTYKEDCEKLCGEAVDRFDRMVRAREALNAGKKKGKK